MFVKTLKENVDWLSTSPQLNDPGISLHPVFPFAVCPTCPQRHFPLCVSKFTRFFLYLPSISWRVCPLSWLLLTSALPFSLCAPLRPLSPSFVLFTPGSLFLFLVCLSENTWYSAFLHSFPRSLFLSPLLHTQICKTDSRVCSYKWHSSLQRNKTHLHHLIILILAFTIILISAAFLILFPLSVSLINYTSFLFVIYFYARITLFNVKIVLYLSYFSFPFTNTIVFSTVHDLYPIMHYLLHLLSRCTFTFISSCNIVVSCVISPYAWREAWSQGEIKFPPFFPPHGKGQKVWIDSCFPFTFILGPS